MMTKVVAQRIDNGWLVSETGKEADGSTYKHTKAVKDAKAAAAAFGEALEINQSKLTEED